jgi:FKBP-type peptidyl-prolyl cis-trans isomerase 2
VICVGEGHLFKKIEENIVGKEAGRSYKAELSPEESFGKKDAKLFRMIPVSVFKKNKMNPVPGLTLEVDGMMGVVRTVGGGRCMVDFNHPLSGKDVVYTLKVNKIVKDVVDKVKAIIEMDLRINDFKVEQKEKSKDIDVMFDEKVSKHLTDEMKKTVEKRVKDLVGIKINIK